MDRLEEMISDLLYWYRYNARVLPWRENPSAYHVWVSEIMLQQTRVEAVRGYYLRFLEELPDIKALADCREEKLLKLWEGLGYYSRVRNLQKAAKIVCEQYNGELPDSVSELRKLPGIGDYTAGAIASIAFAKPEPAVDGNVLRVVSRVEGLRDDIMEPQVRKKITARLYPLMPKEDSGLLNQAVMDLGATVCIPRGTPHCEECPLQHLCVAFHEGSTSEIPVRAPKKERRIEEKTVFYVEYKDGVLLHKRSGKGLLAGMWEYPNAEGRLRTPQAKKRLAELLTIDEKDIVKMLPCADEKHVFTHVEWYMKTYRVQIEKAPKDSFIIATREEVAGTYSLPSAFGKLRF